MSKGIWSFFYYQQKISYWVIRLLVVIGLGGTLKTLVTELINLQFTK